MIPPQRAAELRSALMAWRREIRAVRGTEAERLARDGVQAAKVALGERGRPWWEQTIAERRQRWETAVPLPRPKAPGTGHERVRPGHGPECDDGSGA